MISYQLARPFHFYSINILAALKSLRLKPHNKIYMAQSFLVQLKKNCTYTYVHVHRHTNVQSFLLDCCRFLKCPNFKNTNTKLHFPKAMKLPDYRILTKRNDEMFSKCGYVSVQKPYRANSLTQLLFLIYIQYSLFKVVTAAVRLNQGGPL